MPNSTGLVLAFVFLFGTVVGSFLNVVIHRLPRGEGLNGRSACPHCRERLAWFDLVPLLSFAVLGGRCRHCFASIAWRYPLVELLTGLLAVAVLVRFGAGPVGLVYFAFGAALVAVTLIDLDWQIIPDAITLPGVVAGLVAAAALELVAGQAGAGTFPAHTLRAVGGAVGGALGLWLVATGYRRATGVEGLGFGDVKLAALLGAFLGVGGVFLTIFLASLAGSLIGGLMIATGRGTVKTALPFGAFLAPIGVFVLFFGPALVGWYLGLFGGRASG
jgi:leader peptidase (prepilin peptidase)/N-methyltransferase